MSNIDPSRLAMIFRALSATESQKNRIEKNQTTKIASEDKAPSIEVTQDTKRNKENLKKNIYKRLIALKESEENYQEKAPAIVIREILLWEFGESLMRHPEFNYFCKTIIDQVRNHSDLQLYLSNLIDNIDK